MFTHTRRVGPYAKNKLCKLRLEVKSEILVMACRLRVTKGSWRVANESNIQGPRLMDFTCIKSERGHRNNGRFLFIAHELA